MKKFFKVFFLIVLFLAVAGIAVAAAMNYHVISEGKKYNITPTKGDKEDKSVNFDADYVVVLGASVRPGGKLSEMLENRMAIGCSIFNNGAGKTLILSGDSQDTSNYDETGPMKKYAMDESTFNIPEESILVDKYGVSTYDTIHRLLEKVENEGKKPEDVKIVIVTQRYHLYRAVYDARSVGFKAYGYEAEFPNKSKLYDEGRELIGRCKDVVYTLLNIDVQYNTKDFNFGG